jgi:hypothetical protein
MKRQPVINASCDYPAAVLKGVIEHDDGTAYFGSLGGYARYLDVAVELGWIFGTVKPTATPLGRRVYRQARLDGLPRIKGSRAYLWNWSRIHLLAKRG